MTAASKAGAAVIVVGAGVTGLSDLLRIGDPRRQVANLTAPGGQMGF